MSFVFSVVDNNTDYDALEQLSRDAEDKYFNDDDSETSDVKSQPVAEYDFWSACRTVTVANLIGVVLCIHYWYVVYNKK